MALKIAQRGQIPAFLALETLRIANERARDGADVLHLEIGEPFEGAPAEMLDALKSDISAKPIAYTESLGIRELRERIAAIYPQRYGVDVPAERVAVTFGSSAAFILTFMAAFEPGDRVALAVPCYPAYRNILLAMGLKPVELLCGPETNFQPTPQMLDDLDEPIDGLILASPANPTGTMLMPEELRALSQWCVRNEVRLISDEIYHGITFGKPVSCALENNPDAVIVNSFSKYYSMSGWRIGWTILPEDMVRPVERLCQSLFISAPAMSQYAALKIFDYLPLLDERVAVYAKNRAYLQENLPRAGLTNLSSADGGFYFYADVSRFTNDSQEFCRRMLTEIDIAATPGADFDPERGHRYIRLSYAGPTQDMEQACGRMRRWLVGEDTAA